MSESERPKDASADRRTLAALVAEAKAEPVADQVDWSRLEANVLRAIATEKSALVREVEAGSRLRTRDKILRGGAVVFAIAAAVVLFVRKDRDAAIAVARPPVDVSAGALRTTEGAGNVRIAGVAATAGAVLHAGDTIDVDDAHAVFERPRKVTWLLEQDTPEGGAARAHVESASDSLVLGLDNGVIEAQVTPVPNGEAFAVDVAAGPGVVRVAVHGTHFRVARRGDHVVVDLTEGVVSIGVPPRTGATYGTLVTAPAHVELDATDLSTLRVDHEASAVRAAIGLGNVARTAVRPALPTPAAEPTPIPPPQPKGAVARPVETVTVAPIVEPPKSVPPPPPRDAIAIAVRDCATAAGSRSGEVHVTVTSHLHLRVASGGMVESAQFSPPLLPEIQTCAAQVIYKTKLEETGLVTIPIEFSY